jgi:hypothetical protein
MMLQRRAFRSRMSPRRRSRLFFEELEHRNLLSVFTPAQVRHAYGFDQVSFSSGGQTAAGDGRGQTIAIVDAFDDPNIANDLAVFDQTFKLAAPPKFTKVNQSGGTQLPPVDGGWSQETSLDVEWAHAVAPAANILLVEANSDSLNDLLASVDFARQQPGVVAVSMSWGVPESELDPNSILGVDKVFTTPAGHGGVTFVAASGDSGAWYGADWPAVSPNVLSVGGTSLTVRDSLGTYGSERGWNGSGGGISQVESEPAYQTGVQRTGGRTTPDVSFDASPNTAFYVYDSVPISGQAGWFAVGGTSAAAPQWAGLVAVVDQGRAALGKGSLDGPTQTLPGLYSAAQTAYSSNFHDVTSGSNGYSARVGYDLVTGLGTPVANHLITTLVGPAAAAPVAALTTTTSAKTKPATGKAQPVASTPVGDTGETHTGDAPVAGTSPTPTAPQQPGATGRQTITVSVPVAATLLATARPAFAVTPAAATTTSFVAPTATGANITGPVLTPTPTRVESGYAEAPLAEETDVDMAPAAPRPPGAPMKVQPPEVKPMLPPPAVDAYFEADGVIVPEDVTAGSAALPVATADEAAPTPGRAAALAVLAVVFAGARKTSRRQEETGRRRWALI